MDLATFITGLFFSKTYLSKSLKNYFVDIHNFKFFIVKVGGTRRACLVAMPSEWKTQKWNFIEILKNVYIIEIKIKN